jgi:hypothetical protein
MRPAASFRLRIALLAPAVLMAALLPLVGVGTAAELEGCNGTCDAHLVGVVVEPPTSCVVVGARVCDLGSEVVTIGNECNSALTLTSPDFHAPGTVGVEGGLGVSPLSVPAHGILALVAGPNAIGADTLSLSGTLGGSPILITVAVASGAPEGGVDAGPGESTPDSGEPMTPTDSGSGNHD